MGQCTLIKGKNTPYFTIWPAGRVRDTVENVLSSNPLNITFRRAIVGNKLDAWMYLVARIEPIQLTDFPDTFKWNSIRVVCFQ